MFSKFKSFLFENSSVNQTIAKNTFWLFGGQAMSRLMRAALVVYAARVLGASSWGAFSYALGITTFLTVLSDIGIGALLTKEAARAPEKKTAYLATALRIKLVLILVIAVIIAFVFPQLAKIPESAALIPILIFAFAFDALRDLGAALARSLEHMEIEAGVQVFTNFAIAALGFLFLAQGGGSRLLAVSYAAGSGIGLIAIFFALRKYLGNLLRAFRKELIGPILKTAWPFGLLGLLGVIMLNTDIIMLGWLRAPEEVGYYSAAQKIIQLLYVLPALFSISVFPALARTAVSDPNYAKKLLERSVALAIAAAVPIAILGVLLGDWLIPLLFGPAYLAAASTFKILSLTVLIVYPAGVIGNAIFAYDATKYLALFVGAAAISNVFFNLLLIPRFGIEGAAFATILAELLSNAILWRKIKQINGFKILPALSELIGFKNAKEPLG